MKTLKKLVHADLIAFAELLKEIGFTCVEENRCFRVTSPDNRQTALMKIGDGKIMATDLLDVGVGMSSSYHGMTWKYYVNI